MGKVQVNKRPEGGTYDMELSDKGKSMEDHF